MRMGQRVLLYSGLGEDCWRSWIEGRFYIVCSPEYKYEKEQQEWWIQVKMADGSLAWTNSPESFISQDRMDDELGKTIADPALALQDKLAKIDEMIKAGADLNGSAGQHGICPVEAVIFSKQPELLTELISRGMNIQTGEPSPEYWAAQNALQPGGEVMLKILLEKGLKLNCLTTPPLHEFLSGCMGSGDCPIEQAIKVAEMLVQYGADVEQRDVLGRTIFVVLDQKDSASRPHIAVLREALLKLKK